MIEIRINNKNKIIHNKISYFYTMLSFVKKSRKYECKTAHR